MLAWQQILLRLKREIRLGLRASGSLLPPEVHLASELGVSRKTLRRAFDELSSEGLLIRCKHIGTRISPDAAAKVQVPLRLAVVLNVLPGKEQLSSSYLLAPVGAMTEIHYLIRRFISQGDHLQLLSDHAFMRDQELWQKFDGLIFSPPQSEVLSLKVAAERRFPHINLESGVDCLGVNTILADDEQAAYDCTRELLQEGHRKIAFLGGALRKGAQDCGFRRRTCGYLRACADFSVVPKPEWIFNLANQDQYSMSELLADYPVRIQGCEALVAAIGTSLLELERLRRLYGETMYPSLPSRCIDLTPLNLGAAELGRLQNYVGFCKPRQQVADLAYDNLLSWIGHPDYQPGYHKVPFLPHVPVLNQHKEVIYAEA